MTERASLPIASTFSGLRVRARFRNHGTARGRCFHLMTNACIGSSNMRGTSFNMPGVPSGGLEESPMLPEFP